MNDSFANAAVFPVDKKPVADISEHFDVFTDLTASDDQIVAAVQDAELPALLAALAVLMADSTLLAKDLVPPTPPMGASLAAQGGMTSEAQAKARALVVSALIRARDHGWPKVLPTPAMLRAAIEFLTKDAGEQYSALLDRELSLPKDVGKPGWQTDDLAPERSFQVVVIGAGLAGIAAAYRLTQAKVPFVVLEKSPGPGGVWHNNTYPGCRLDTPNFAYGFSFAQKSDWPQQYSKRDEIVKYIDSVIRHAGLLHNFEFETEVLRMRYDAQRGGWWITTRHGGQEKTYFANVVISAVGHLNRPSVPELPGGDLYSGKAFHSAEWPDSLDVRGKRVAVIGTGASGFQIIPAIADQAESLSVFQRNASWMLPTPNYHDDIRPGMKWLLTRVPYYGRWYRFWQFWIATEGRFPSIKVDPDWVHPISVSALNEELRQECLASLAAQCGDRSDLLEKLTPKYAPGAKRMVRDNGAYIRTLKRSNVKLLTERITNLAPAGIVTADGLTHEVDLIVYATGFHASDYLAPIEVIGESGSTLHEFWQGDCRGYLGISIPDFPNLFVIGGPNSGLVVNGSAIVTSESALQYVMSAIEYMLRDNAKAVDVRSDVYASFNEEIDQENLKRTWGATKVNTWYKGINGRAAVPWPYPIVDYFSRTSRFDPSKYNITR